ncbi:MAG: hypothetical protein ACI84K_001493 [Pseudohongiellaceae bacterium]|jgi:hypothetical protein
MHSEHIIKNNLAKGSSLTVKPEYVSSPPFLALPLPLLAIHRNIIPHNYIEHTTRSLIQSARYCKLTL